MSVNKIMKKINTLLRFYSVSCVVSLFCIVSSGCGIFNSYDKNVDGYYERHYVCCGPQALAKAFSLIDARAGILYARNPYPSEEISRRIQDNGIKLKEFLALFNKGAICITWPGEMKATAEQYGFEVITLKEFEELDPEKDVAVVLVHSELNNYHWLVFPIDDPEDYYGIGTKVDKIYLFKKNAPKR